MDKNEKEKYIRLIGELYVQSENHFRLSAMYKLNWAEDTDAFMAEENRLREEIRYTRTFVSQNNLKTIDKHLNK